MKSVPLFLEPQSVGAIRKDETIQGLFIPEEATKTACGFSVICSAQLRLRHRDTMSWSSIKAANRES